MMKKHINILLRKRINLTEMIFFSSSYCWENEHKKINTDIHPTLWSGCVGRWLYTRQKKGGYTTSKKSKTMPLLIQYHSNPTKLIKYENFNTIIPCKTKARSEMEGSIMKTATERNVFFLLKISTWENQFPRYQFFIFFIPARKWVSEVES